MQLISRKGCAGAVAGAGKGKGKRNSEKEKTDTETGMERGDVMINTEEQVITFAKGNCKYIVAVYHDISADIYDESDIENVFGFDLFAQNTLNNVCHYDLIGNWGGYYGSDPETNGMYDDLKKLGFGGVYSVENMPDRIRIIEEKRNNLCGKTVRDVETGKLP